MGASQSSQSNVKKNIELNKGNKNKEDELINGILTMSRELYKKYSDKLSDVSLCEQIVIVSADKLAQFDTFILRKISEKQNNITLKGSLILA